MFKRHGGKAAKAAASSSGGDAATSSSEIARYKNQAAKARERIVDLVTNLNKLNNEHEALTLEHEKLTTDHEAQTEVKEELEKQVRTLQEERDNSVQAKDDAEHELELATDAKNWAETNTRNAIEDATVQRKAKEKADQDCKKLREQLAKSNLERDKAKKELATATISLEHETFANRKARGGIVILENKLKEKIEEMERRLAQSRLEHQRTRALGEDRESELNRWVERLTNQVFQLRKDIKRAAELTKSKWRIDEEIRLEKEIQRQTKNLERQQHRLLLSMSDPMLRTSKSMAVKKKIKLAQDKIEQLDMSLHRTRCVVLLPTGFLLFSSLSHSLHFFPSHSVHGTIIQQRARSTPHSNFCCGKFGRKCN